MSTTAPASLPHETLSTSVAAPPPPNALAAESQADSNGIVNGTTNQDRHQYHDFDNDIDLSTLALHADDSLREVTDIAPPLHMTTTFHYAHDPDALIAKRDLPPDYNHPYVYSRHSTRTPTRLESLLTPLLHAPTLIYSSGLTALHALYTHLLPSRVSITGGYHGTHAVLSLHQRFTHNNLTILPLSCPASDLGPGDVIHLETPLNPTGEARNIASYAEKAHSRGAWLVVDATFAPPGLQDPFEWGADVVMHSGTKYLGGHSDLLMGVLATRNTEWVKGLREERAVMGGVVGGLEAWLGVRSLRTLGVRVERQSKTAGGLVGWLDEKMRREGKGEGDEEEESKKDVDMNVNVVKEVVERVWHASLQKEDLEGKGEEDGKGKREGWLKKQMPNGFGPVFAVTMREEWMARRLPSKLRFWMHATSLGGVESLVEWRAMSDDTVDSRLLRFSTGLEAEEDLRGDLLRGFEKLQRERGEMREREKQRGRVNGEDKKVEGESVESEVAEVKEKENAEKLHTSEDVGKGGENGIEVNMNEENKEVEGAGRGQTNNDNIDGDRKEEEKEKANREILAAAADEKSVNIIAGS